jgi:cell wall-associated NlpC family hydrolase
MPGKLNGVALAAIGAGSILTWSGIKGWSVIGTIGDVISGKAPNQQAVYPLAAPGAQSSGAQITGATGSAISDDAIKYEGHAYSYGGAPGTNGTNPWDCSSFCNWVIGHDMHMAIPGIAPGQYNGSSHGPPTGAWGIWPGLHKITRSQIQAGDLIVWTFHMGIAISNTDMVSALDPADGTKVTAIDKSGNGPLLRYGRL